MYVYQLSYGEYDNRGELELTHETFFEIEEWNRMVFECALIGAKKHFEREATEYTEVNQPNFAIWGEENMNGMGDHYKWWSTHMRVLVQMHDVLHDVFELLQERYGFKQIQYAQRTYFGESGNFFDEPDPIPGHLRLEDQIGNVLRKTVYVNPKEPEEWKAPWARSVSTEEDDDTDN